MPLPPPLPSVSYLSIMIVIVCKSFFNFIPLYLMVFPLATVFYTPSINLKNPKIPKSPKPLIIPLWLTTILKFNRKSTYPTLIPLLFLKPRGGPPGKLVINFVNCLKI
jgi:hypothetical protein